MVRRDVDQALDFPYMDDDDYNYEYTKPMPEIEDPWAGAGDDKLPADLPELAVAKDGKVMELVHREYIRALLKSPPRTHPLPYGSVEALRGSSRTCLTDEDLDRLVSTYRNVQRGRDIKNDIIQQYLHKGYAYTALPENSTMYPAAPAELPPVPYVMMNQTRGAALRQWSYVVLLLLSVLCSLCYWNSLD